jgi:hypothetical protein
LSTAQAVEQFRLECEARDWLRRGYDSPSSVDDLMQRIAKLRGQEAADLLREEMRRQWRLQRGAEA